MDLFDGRYEKIELIGRGAFSEVWKVTDTQTGVIMALKIYTAQGDMDEDGIKMLTREFALMIDADHQNLLRPSYFGVSKEGKQPYLTLPYCKRGNINKMMGDMTEREAWKLIRDIASALAYLHAMNPPIIHQDIKPANILIGNDGYYKLSDFGVSTKVQSSMKSFKNDDGDYTSAGTISYMAPEKFSQDNRPIMANDIYSLGATVFEMLAGYLPFGEDGGLIQKKGAEVPVLPGNYSPQLKKVIQECLDEEPWKRPTASKLEEIAIDAFSKSPTVIIDVEQETVSDNTIQDAENGSPLKTRVEGEGCKKPICKKSTIIGSIAAIAILAIAAYFLFFSSSSDEHAIDQTPPPAITQPPVEDIKASVEEIKAPVEETKVEEKPVITSEPKVVSDEPNKTITSSSTTPATTSKELDLGYAVWEGNSVDGKPDGYGTMTFRKSHRIDSRDEQGRIAQSGDKVNGNYVNGHLDYGTWIKSDGGQEDILIGQ